MGKRTKLKAACRERSVITADLTPVMLTSISCTA
jgi:hypothetical protein